ncbi:rCG31191 [Rattus norvegicus]|uniref:RCG31191 n=1 Tax=Rattus norvegicus TaxID=10116 RepID=A6IUM2_RAT|nr:rCG31191 [Rattus norvegicus]
MLFCLCQVIQMSLLALCQPSRARSKRQEHFFLCSWEEENWACPKSSVPKSSVAFGCCSWPFGSGDIWNEVHGAKTPLQKLNHAEMTEGL